MCCFSGFGYLRLGSLEFPISPLPSAIRAHHAALPLLGGAICCCLGLSCSFPSEGVSLLKGKQTNNPVSESAFRSLHPSGGKKSSSYCSWSNQQLSGLAQGSLSGAGGAGDHFAGLCRHTAGQLGPTECDCSPQERIKISTQA